MNDRPGPTTTRYSPVWQLVLARLRELYREPEALFWVYGFPVLLTVALGIAFRNKPEEQVAVDVQTVGGREEAVFATLREDRQFVVQKNDEATSLLRLRTGKTALVVVPEGESGYRYVFDQTS